MNVRRDDTDLLDAAVRKIDFGSPLVEVSRTRYGSSNADFAVTTKAGAYLVKISFRSGWLFKGDVK